MTRRYWDTPDVAHVRSMQDRDEYHRELLALRESLRWLLRITAEGAVGEAGEDGTPAHSCEFTTNPEKGACDFHFLWWQAVDRAGLLEHFASAQSADAPQSVEVPRDGAPQDV